MELTQEEKDAPSFLDWPNERLGQFTKECAVYLSSKRIDGYTEVTIMAAVMILISRIREANIGVLTLELKDVTSEMFPESKNFKITIEEV